MLIIYINYINYSRKSSWILEKFMKILCNLVTHYFENFSFRNLLERSQLKISENNRYLKFLKVSKMLPEFCFVDHKFKKRVS